jgi:hypothetical protein
MKYAVEMGCGAMIYVPSFIQFGSGIKNRWGIHMQMQRQQGDMMSLLSFYQNEESRLKTMNGKVF